MHVRSSTSTYEDIVHSTYVYTLDISSPVLLRACAATFTWVNEILNEMVRPTDVIDMLLDSLAAAPST